MNISDLQNKTVGILGFGQEGDSIAKFLTAHAFSPKVFDKQPQDQLPDQYKTQLENLKLDYFSDDDYLSKALTECEIVFRSPGVKLSTENLELAKQNNVTITSQAEWFFDNCPAKIIGITGTKGKGTTSSLIYEIIKSSDWPGQVFLTGNIGKIQPFEILEQLTERDIVVYEMSSFQLEFLKKSPHIGVCLMVTEDHLDYHGTTEDYTAAKGAISKYQTANDFCVYNIDYENSKMIGELGDGQRFQVTASDKDLTNGTKIIDEAIEFYENSKQVSTIDCSQRMLRGKHNLENIAAAAQVAKILKINNETISKSIADFKGLEHRLQFVGEHDNIKYYNDSISTIPETTIAALKSFTEPIVLLLGGATKNLDYTELESYLQKLNNLKAVVCLGQTGADIYKHLSETPIANKVFGPFNNFSEAVNKSIEIAEAGDIVLLSPAATSFDMFRNYKERGEEFVKIISAL
jgi:UDP-N-acetylmuramoylalanine--D-glutamate ligase